MSKIGNLIKKLTRKKKKSQDLDEVFSDEFQDSDIEENYEDPDSSAEEILVKKDGPSEQNSKNDNSQEINLGDMPPSELPNDDEFKQSDIASNETESTQANIPPLHAESEEEELSDEYTDEPFEDGEQKVPDFDQTTGTGIDLSLIHI